MDGQFLIKVFLVLLPMLLSLTVHEWAHAFAAKSLGDDTAERMGRLTLSPLAHIDPIGTIIVPLAIFLMNGAGLGAPMFGWAKPVPFNAARFKRSVNMRTGASITASAGPISNVLLAILAFAGLSLGYKGIVNMPEAALQFFEMMATINVSLAIFNMVPVGPLDGQKVLTGFLPHNLAMDFERFNVRYGTMLLMGVIFFGQQIIQTPWLYMMRGLQYVFGLA